MTGSKMPARFGRKQVCQDLIRSRAITRRELAVLLDRYAHVFEQGKVNLNGDWR